MGTHGLNMILETAGLTAYMDQLPPDNMTREVDFAILAAINQALEAAYGARGGRGMALRIGREMVRGGLNRFGVFAGMSDPAFQALPLQQRVWLGLQALVAVFTRFCDQPSHLEEHDDHYILIIKHEPFSWGRVADAPVGHALAGIIQQVLHWATDGYEFHVQQIACRAVGAEDSMFKINKNPIGGVSFG
ncbi:MAG: 4-vinyl reductase [Phototrophicales bacterium]|nr:MAG: 4-vinyl reductase [Phototrophicales bacterium]